VQSPSFRPPMARLVRELLALSRVADARTLSRYLWSIARNFRSIIGSRSLVPADRDMGSVARIFRPPMGYPVILRGSDFSSARELYARRVYFAEQGFDLQPGDIVVDLGANVGVFTVLAARCCRRVIAVEAQKRFIPRIEELLALNGCADRATVLHGIVGPATGIFSSSDNLPIAEAPPELDLTQVFDTHDLAQVDFLKIDIEGSEFDLFRSDVNWLGRVQRIAMEVHPEYGSPKDLAAVLLTEGFRVSLFDNDNHRTQEIAASGGYMFAIRLSRADEPERRRLSTSRS
jgi:FkbM family methyltransferase